METDWYLAPINLDYADELIIRRLTGTPENLQGRGIDLTITDHNEPVDMTGQDVYLAWRHLGYDAEGSIKCEEVDASQGHYRVYYPQAMQHTGEIAARFMIWVKDGLILDSRVFRINVEINVIKDDLALRDTDFSMFVQAIQDLHVAEGNAGEATEKAQKAAEEAEAAMNRATTAAERAEAAEQSMTTAEAQRVEAEQGRVEAEDAREAKETEREGNEDARQQAENARDEAEQARAQAESDRVEEFERLSNESTAATNAANNAADTANQTNTNVTLAEQGRVEAENEREEYYEDIQQRVNDGAFNGATFSPYWSESEQYPEEEPPVSSVLNWSNDKGLPNPSPVDLRGPMGPQGPSGFTHDLSGMFWMGVETDGNMEGWLFVATAEGEEPPDFEYEDETGDLYVNWPTA